MMSAMKLPSGRRVHEGIRPKWRPIPFWPWTLAAAAAVVIGASVSIILLLAIAGGAKPGTDRANARLDAVRTGLAVGAGIGAAAGLVLAFRRQHHQEIATDLTDWDATERRITELYTKAVEQLGSDKAPVRLGGLYALERLAQDNPAHRQTIVNVICAYLRMPFYPEDPDPMDEGTSLDEETVTPGGKKSRCVSPRSEFLPSICVMTGPKISAPPILRPHVFGLTSASILSAPLSLTSASKTA